MFCSLKLTVHFRDAVSVLVFITRGSISEGKTILKRVKKKKKYPHASLVLVPLPFSGKSAATFLPPEVLSAFASSVLSLPVDLERLLLSLSLERGESGGLALLLCLEEPAREAEAEQSSRCEQDNTHV